MQVKNISRNRLDLGPFFRKKGCQAIAKQSPCFPWSVAAAGGGVIGGDRAGGSVLRIFAWIMSDPGPSCPISF